MGKLPISMAIFHSYVMLVIARGYSCEANVAFGVPAMKLSMLVKLSHNEEHSGMTRIYEDTIVAYLMHEKKHILSFYTHCYST